MDPHSGLPSVYVMKKYALMLANCCAVNPVSFRMVGASAASMVRWKNESHEHAAIAKHGTHICQVTAARSAVVVAVTVFTPVVVDINLSSGLRYPLDISGTRGSYHGLGHRYSVNHLVEWNGKRRSAARGFRKSFQSGAAGVKCFSLPHLGIAFRRLKLAGAEQPRASFFRGRAGD